jgi:hypothetical protein
VIEVVVPRHVLAVLSRRTLELVARLERRSGW